MPEIKLPGRIILSRKGVDAGEGGFPSLIWDGRLLNIPIPERHFEHPLTYGQLPVPPGPWQAFGTLGELVRLLSAGRLTPESRVHRDPDIRLDLHGDAAQCRKALGQCCAADALLARVEKGDLFLFFGWFARAKVTDGNVRPLQPEEHTIWGWLQTDQPRRHLMPEQQPSHPHEYPLRDGVAHAGNHNSLYRALNELTFLPNIPGCGLFSNWSETLRLTHPACRQGCRSLWKLPSFFSHSLSGLGPGAVWTNEGSCTVVQVVGQYQEYVYEVPDDDAEQEQIAAWLQSLPW